MSRYDAVIASLNATGRTAAANTLAGIPPMGHGDGYSRRRENVLQIRRVIMLSDTGYDGHIQSVYDTMLAYLRSDER